MFQTDPVSPCRFESLLFNTGSVQQRGRLSGDIQHWKQPGNGLDPVFT
jgi:hypothetical protein